MRYSKNVQLASLLPVSPAPLSAPCVGFPFRRGLDLQGVHAALLRRQPSPVHGRPRERILRRAFSERRGSGAKNGGREVGFDDGIHEHTQLSAMPLPCGEHVELSLISSPSLCSLCSKNEDGGNASFPVQILTADKRRQKVNLTPHIDTFIASIM